MPTRILRDWTDSPNVNSLSDSAEKFFVRLIQKADDFGRYHGSPKMLRPMLYPLQLDRVREADIDRLIAECVKASLVRLYESEGKQVLEINKFGQRCRAGTSKFPACDGRMTVTCQTPAPGVGAGREVEDEGGGVSGRSPHPPEVSETPPTQPDAEGTPTLEDCMAFANHPTCGFPLPLVEEWYLKQCDRGWGNDWRARMRGSVATWREIAFKRKIFRRQTGFDHSKNKNAPRQPVNEMPVSSAPRTTTSAGPRLMPPGEMMDGLRKLNPALAAKFEEKA